MGTSYNPRIVTDGLVLCLDAANARSYPGTGTTWTDLKSGNSGTLTNMADNFDSANGGSLTFDGADERITFGSDGAAIVNGLSELTLEICFKASAISSDRGLIFGDFVSNGADNGFALRFDDSGLSGGGNNVIKTGFGANNGSQGSSLESSSNIQSTDWMCISVVCDVGTSIDLYKDGLLDTPTNRTHNASVTSVSNCSSLQIGQGAKSVYWSGKIQTVRIYNRILTSNEIRQNYLATKERYA
jgi:hypothetical protein